MNVESHIVTSNPEDITLRKDWCRQQTDRLIAWEMLSRYLKGESGVPVKSLNLCDRIGVSKTYVTTLIKGVREKLNPEQDAE